MRTRARVLGHPVHTMLVPIPFGLYLVASGLDIAQRVTGADWIPRVTFWNIAIGVAAALVAAVFGLIDWTGIPSNTRAKRNDARAMPPPTAAFALEVRGLALVFVTGWLGGELVNRVGVGGDEGANVQAPSSLTHGTT